MRILKTLELRPRRTIASRSWAGEEQGLLGSKAYVEAAPGRRRAMPRTATSLYVYFNFDNGYPPVTGFYMEGNEPAKRDHGPRG